MNVRFFTLMLTLFSFYLNIVRFACSQARFDTQELPEDAPQNGWVVVEVSPSYVRFLPLCSPPSQFLNIVRFACSQARLDTQELPEDAPQNGSQNGWVVVEVRA